MVYECYHHYVEEKEIFYRAKQHVNVEPQLPAYLEKQRLQLFVAVRILL
jgi:hypothetical protein